MDILLVDDSRGDAGLVREALRDERPQCTLHVVTDGVEAVDFLHRRKSYAAAPRPDLIRLDLNMPRKDGREVLAEVKTDKELKAIPVVVLTTSDADQDVSTCYSLHCNCYITKPVVLDDFVNTVGTINRFWRTVAELPTRKAQSEVGISWSAVAGGSDGPSAARQPTPRRPMEILVAEDNPDHAVLIRRVIKQADPRHNVTLVAEGAEAMAYLLRQGDYADAPCPDLVLLNLRLPHADGREILPWVKQDEQLKRIPVVVMADSDTDPDILRGYSLHANCYVMKPVDHEEFASAVRAIERFWLSSVKLPRVA